MGDMKTPDFDDLLAAFDIPDMVDPKVAIESGNQEEHTRQAKQSSVSIETCEGETQNLLNESSVSVIVKNIKNMEPIGDVKFQHRVNGHHNSPPPLVTNGHANGSVPIPFASDKGEGQKGSKQEQQSLFDFSQFSPISSAEELDEHDNIEVGVPINKLKVQDVCMSNGAASNELKTPLTEDSPTKSSSINKPDQNNKSVTAKAHKSIVITSSKRGNINETTIFQNDGSHDAGKSVRPEAIHVLDSETKYLKKVSSSVTTTPRLKTVRIDLEDVTNSGIYLRQKSSHVNRAPQFTKKQREWLPDQNQSKAPSLRQPESPSNVTSESCGKSSPDSSTDSAPYIPKVRIKTIKTSSGHIKRTVTRVSDCLKREEENLCVITNSNGVFSSPMRPPPATRVATNGGAGIEGTKQMTIKPVATAFLPISAVKTAGSQIINLKLSNNTTIKATVIPAASMPGGGNAILKAANAIQQQTVRVPASGQTNAKLMPKKVHLGNVNLMPQSASSTPHQQVKHVSTLSGKVTEKSSKVQVIAKSHSSVVEAFNKVLSSINPLPAYIPNLSPPSLASISLPAMGYKCLECGDSFALEKSLTQHYERRSVRIEVTCNHCGKGLVFFNKCSLLSHARGHKDNGVVMQCSHLILKPIPVDQMLSVLGSSEKNSVAHTSLPSKAQIQRKVAASDNQSAVIPALRGAPSMAAVPLEDDGSKLNKQKQKCVECKKMFQDEHSLAMHYQHVPESSAQKSCPVCQMLLPNQCSFLSHQRIHQHKPPYTCPECGASCRSVKFQSHITKCCLHFTRRVAHRCVQCSVIFADVATLKAHIQSSHCEVFYKCALCPMAFKSAPGINSHVESQHPGVKPGDPKVINKCSMCDTVFTLQSLLYTHFDLHTISHKVTVFKCPDCLTHFAQKQLLLDHIESTHGTIKSVEGPPNQGAILPLSSKPTSSNSNNKSHQNRMDRGHTQESQEEKASLIKKTNNKCITDSKHSCRDCNNSFSTRENLVTHMSREHGKKMKKHLCQQCDRSFNSSQSLCKHNCLKHKGQKKVHNCPHCPALSQTYTKRVLLDQHIQMMHPEVKPPKRKNDNEDDSSERKMSQSHKRKTEDEKQSQDMTSWVTELKPLKRLKVNILKLHKCAVCNLTTEDIAVFREHIPRHKSDNSSFQCQECGLCYTSPRSLARHLFIIHRLKEPHRLARYSRWDKEDEKSQRENQQDVANENNSAAPNTKCKVCGKMFETEAHLNTHMRTHGMAFIKAKRLSADKVVTGT